MYETDFGNEQLNNSTTTVTSGNLKFLDRVTLDMGGAAGCQKCRHFSRRAFLVEHCELAVTIKKAEDAGLRPDEGPTVFLNKTVILRKG